MPVIYRLHINAPIAASRLIARAWDVTTTMPQRRGPDHRGAGLGQRRARRGRGWQRGQV